MNSVISGEEVGRAIWQTLSTIGIVFLSHLWPLLLIAVPLAAYWLVIMLIPKRRGTRA